MARPARRRDIGSGDRGVLLAELELEHAEALAGATSAAAIAACWLPATTTIGAAIVSVPRPRAGP